MKTIDLTHFLENNMTVYSKKLDIDVNHAYTHKQYGFRGTKLNLFSHHGTHIDAPAHVLSDGKFLDDFDLDKFCGSALLINLENKFLDNNKITIDMLYPYENKIKNHEVIILKTGNYKFWNQNKYLDNFPILTKESAKYLSSFNIKIIGFDTISPDVYESHEYEIHKIFLEKEILIAENLDLSNELPDKFKFMAIPLKYKHSDGSPIRVMAIY